MFFRNLLAKREPSRKLRFGMCGAGRPSRFAEKENDSETLSNYADSFDEKSLKNDKSDVEEDFSHGNSVGGSPRYSANDRYNVPEHGLYGRASRELSDSNAQYINQQRLMYNGQKPMPQEYEARPTRYSDLQALQYAQGPPAVHADVISSRQQPIQRAYAVNPQVQGINQHEQQQRQMQYQQQVPTLQERQSSLMSDPASNSFSQYPHAGIAPGQMIRQHPLPGTSQAYPADQPLPVLKIDMPTRDSYQQKQYEVPNGQPQARPMGSSDPKNVYHMNPISVNNPQAFTELPYDMQAAVIKNMGNSYRTVVPPQTLQQAKMNPHVNAVLSADREQRSAEALKAMAAQGGSSNYILADMQRQLQTQQMDEALRTYKEQNPGANVQSQMQFQHLSQQQQQQQQKQQQQQIYQNQQSQLQYQTMLQNQYAQQQPEQQPNRQQTGSFSSQHSNGAYQQMIAQNNYALAEQNDKEGDGNCMNGCNISRVTLKVFSVTQRKSYTDPSQTFDQNQVIQRDIVLFQLLPDPELLEIEAFLSVEECSHAIELANRSTGLSCETVHPYVSILHLPETDHFISILRTRAARCLDEPVSNTSNPVIYKFDAAPKNALSTSGTFPALEDNSQAARTLLVYLNGDVEGGEIEMPNLGIAILPKQGYALSWRSIGVDGLYDPKTYYRNLPVRKGTLYCFAFYIKI